MDDIADTIETYDRVADEYVDRHGDRDAVAALVDEFCERVDGGRVLDVGCGPGWETAEFASRGFDSVGVDLSPAFLARAAARDGPVGVVRADMRTLPVASDAVDGVWALASLLHVPREDVDDALAEFARVCRPEGSLCCAVKTGDGEYEAATYDDDDRRFTLYEPAAFASRVEAAGFDVEDVTVAEDGDGWVQVYASR
jgi:SAM-dependent methyltransferase